MTGYPSDTLVKVRPFVRKVEGDEATIGDPQRQIFLVIPAAGLDILDWLADGATVGDAVRRFEDKYHETPDIEDFLTALSDEGFLASADGTDTSSDPTTAATPVTSKSAARIRRQWFISCDWIPETVARRLTGPVALVVCAAVIAVGLAMAISEPGLLPGSDVLLFPNGNFAAMTWATFGLAVLAVALHELAHVLVARASGASARVGIGNLMYTMVAQTDMTGMWMTSKRRRYLAFVAGLIVDAVCASAVLGLLFADQRGWITLSETVGAPLAQAVLFTYVLRISFQFFFYLRTDLYYVFATMLNCRDLMGDTERYLYNLLVRAVRKPHLAVDQSGVPRREMRAVRGYAVAYVVGRTFSLLVLLGFFLPLLISLLIEFLLLITGQDSRLTAVDFLSAAIIIALLDGGGLFLWLRSLWRRFRASRRKRPVPATSH
ncbi:MAG TPA: hypothetical protein VF174_11375 [Micromonosporaceae bacterium]